MISCLHSFSSQIFRSVSDSEILYKEVKSIGTFKSKSNILIFVGISSSKINESMEGLAHKCDSSKVSCRPKQCQTF